jgi:glycosidase
LYFLLPDRFSDDNETAYVDNNGKTVTGFGTALYGPGDNANAIRTPEDTLKWLDSGKDFAGGKLRGVKSKLGYLKRMGVTALWIGPLFKQVMKSNTYHGYAVQNFLDVDPRFGTREDLRDLVSTAHSLGIYVLLDIILNHSGNVWGYKDPHFGEHGKDKNGNDLPKYIDPSPVYNGAIYEVEGYYDAARNPTLPMEPVDLSRHPDAIPDGAIWPAELQPMECFTRQGHIQNWDSWPEYLDGDFFDLKDIVLGHDDPALFTPTPALQTLCECYKYWIAYADLDGFRIDTVKHMGRGPTKFFAKEIHEYTQMLGKEKFLLMGEIAGDKAWETVEATGIDAALGIGGVQWSLWHVPKGAANPMSYFGQFANAEDLGKANHTWFRDKVVTMVDDHDQIWRQDSKGRFCSDGNGDKLIFAALALNLCTLGIPCVYYGSEQSFDGRGGNDAGGRWAKDQYIREAMFGGGFGAFRSKGRHFFDESKVVYKRLAEVMAVRGKEIALRRGMQYLREISGDGMHFGYPVQMGQDKIKSVIPWSRIFHGEELLCAVNTDTGQAREAWVTVDSGINQPGGSLSCIFGDMGHVLGVQRAADGRSMVKLKVEPAGFVIYK